MKNLIKKPIVIISFIIVIGIIIGYTYFNREDVSTYDFIIAKRGDLIQEVSVTGKVKPAESVDLAFEKNGKVFRVYINIGDKIQIGQILVRLGSGELSAQLLQAEANLEAEQVRLSELRKGTRPEEIQITETAVFNTQIALEDAKQNLEDVKAISKEDLDSTYEDALNTLDDSYLKAYNASNKVDLIQRTYFGGGTQEDLIVQENKTQIKNNLDQTKNYLDITKNDPKNENTDIALTKFRNSLSNIYGALSTIRDVTETPNYRNKVSSTDKDSLDAHKTNINNVLTNVVNGQQTISSTKLTNTANTNTAESQVSDAGGALKNAEDELNLKKAGATPEQIEAQTANVKSALANVKNYQIQIAKTVLHSPIHGVVTKQDAKVGEIVSANTSIVSLISEAEFQIEANVPEADIAKIKVDNMARLTLDAYGQDVIFQARIIKIDPAETIIEGVTTYKITLQFDIEDERIRSSMTANIDILTNMLKGVIAIPQRAIITKNGERIVRVVQGDHIEEIKVETGIVGKDGMVEIIQGLSEGDQVITFIEE